jgi:hypothetical protein
MKSKTMRWTRHAERMENKGNAFGVSMENRNRNEIGWRIRTALMWVDMEANGGLW